MTMPSQDTLQRELPVSASEIKASNSKDINSKGYWSGVYAMTLCAFALVASEFMPVSLLTPIAQDLAVTEGMAGQAISVSGAFAVITSLSISSLAGNMNRKTLLLWLTGLMFLSGPIIAMAPNYLIYMSGRILIGVAIGGFWSMSAASAIRLVPPEKIPKALAIFNGGNALATVVAAPLGSYLGAVIGWRGAFFCLAPVALLAFVWQLRSLPAMHVEQASIEDRNVLTLLKNPLVAVGMAAASLFFMGQFTLFTYLRPFLETVTMVNVQTLSLILLAIGIAGFAGTVLIGKFLDRRFYSTMVFIPLLMTAIAIALVVFGHQLVFVTVLLSGWGLVATAAPVGWWSWVAKTLPDNAEAGGGLMVALVQLAIGLGSTVGGLIFDAGGYQSTFFVSAGLLMLAALLAVLTARRDATGRS